MAVNPNTDFTTGAVLTAAQQNRFPRGVMGYVKRTAGNLSIGTTNADLTGLSITFTAVAGRVYRVTWTCTGQKQISAGYTAIYCFIGATNLTSVYDTVGPSEYWNCSGSTLIFGYSGSTTVKLMGQTGSNTSILYAGGDPAIFIVEDIGAE